MSTQITYNGVTIPYPRTLDISDEPVYEDGDYLYTKWTFRVAGILYAGSPASPTATSAAQTFNNIEHYLAQPRKRLTYKISGVTILDVDQFADTTGVGDVANGPFAEVLNIARVDGGQVLHVEFRVVVHVRVCDGSSPPTYLSNRWQESVAIDEEQKTTRVRIGRIVLRTDFRAAPDSFRGIATPPIPTGFRRLSSQYEITRDGLQIQYKFEDVETYIQAPVGTVKAAATYRESSPNGATRFAEVNVEITGNFRTNRTDLLARAISVAVQRLERANLVKDRGRWRATGAFEEDMYQPKVKVYLKAMIRPPRASQDGMAMRNIPPVNQPLPPANQPALPINVPGLPGGIGVGGRLQPQFPPNPQQAPAGVNVPGKPSLLVGWGEVPWGSESGLSPDPGIRGTAGLMLLAAALNDPCLTQTLNTGLTTIGGLGAPILLPQNTDPRGTTGGGAGGTTTPPDPFFNPDGFLGGGR